MKKLLIVFGLLLLLGVTVEVFAQEILKGKVPIATATCNVDMLYVMGKDKPLVRPCVLYIDVTNDEMVGYMLIYDDNGFEPQVVVEADFTDLNDLKQKVVWRKGEVSL